jgi:hypothetical protein
MRPRPPTLFGRLTSKLRAHSPPNSPLVSPSCTALSPTRPNTTLQANLAPEREAVFLERGGLLASPKDLSVQEREQERWLATVVRDDVDERDGDQRRSTASKKIQEEWEAKNRGGINHGNSPFRPPRPRGAIYPAVLATPQFGRSKSMPDIAKPMKKHEGAEIINQPRLPASVVPASLRSPRTPLFLRPPVNDESLYYAPSVPSSPLAQQWPRPPPNRSLPPIPTDVEPAPPPLLSPVLISSNSSFSSGRNSFVTAGPFTPMSQGFPLNAPSTPTSPGSRRDGEDTFETENAYKGVTGEFSSYPVRGPVYDGVSLIVNSHALDESSQVESTIVESGRDVVRSTFSVIRPERREHRERKGVLTARGPRRPRTADQPRPMTSDSTSSSQGKSQRRKSFVGQSFHNLRKSVTDTVTKGRSRTSTTPPSSPGLLPGKYDISQLPPSPTLPLPPFTASDFNRLGPLGINIQRRAQRYSIEEPILGYQAKRG